MLTGFISADAGEIALMVLLFVALTSPAEAVHLGVGMLHQDPLHFLALRVLDNLLVGSPGGILPDRAPCLCQALQDLCTQFDFKIDPDVESRQPEHRRTPAFPQIALLLWLGVRVLILDEPTTAIPASSGPSSSRPCASWPARARPSSSFRISWKRWVRPVHAGDGDGAGHGRRARQPCPAPRSGW